MATSTTDPNGRPKTGLHGEGELDRKTDVGTPDRYATEERHGIETGDFDREIDLRRIFWIGFWLVVVVLVSDVVVWGFMRGLQALGDHEQVELTPMQKLPQAPPPEPRLQISDEHDMADMRVREDKEVSQAAWVDQPGGTLRVPVDVAIDAIAQRGVGPFPAMGAAPVAAPANGTSTPVGTNPPPVQPSTPAPAPNAAPPGQ
jgi:hypothetical protein